MKVLLVVTAILSPIFGLGYFFAPEQLARVFGVQADAGMQLMARNFSSALLALAAMA